jgi:hypothetical protein
MKKLLVGMMAMLLLAMTGCGGGSVEVSGPVGPVAYAPSVTLNGFTKDTLYEILDGSVSFYAPDSDIDTMTVVAINPAGYEVSRTVKLINLPGVIQGTIPFSIDYHTFPSSGYAYTFSVYLTDFHGYTSNQAVDIFWVP